MNKNPKDYLATSSPKKLIKKKKKNLNLKEDYSITLPLKKQNLLLLLLYSEIQLLKKMKKKEVYSLPKQMIKKKPLLLLLLKDYSQTLKKRKKNKKTKRKKNLQVSSNREDSSPKNKLHNKNRNLRGYLIKITIVKLKNPPKLNPLEVSYSPRPNLTKIQIKANKENLNLFSEPILIIHLTLSKSPQQIPKALNNPTLSELS